MSSATAVALATIIDELKRRGGSRSTCCPAHEDDSPSLSVRVERGGKVLLKCHAGCTYESIVAAAGLSKAELSGHDRDNDTHWTPYGQAVAVYPYQDASGQLLYEVCRTAAKDFPVRQPDPTSASGYRWKLNGTKPVLYRTPAVRKAIAAGQTIYVVEGEKDVGAVEAHGAVATCNPFGAGKWRPEYSEQLRGAHVVIVADRDVPGYRHAASIRKDLVGIAASIRLVEGVSGKDVTDHLKARYKLDDLREADASRLGQFSGARAHDVEAEEPTELPAPKRLLDLPPTQPREFQIQGLVLKGEVNANVGDGDSGKTTTMLAGAGAVAAGAPAFGELLVHPGPVLFVSGEDQADVIHNHLSALATGHRWDLEATLGNFHVYDEGVDLDDPRWRERLVEIATDLRIVLACFDPIVDLCGDGVDENSNSDAKRVTRYLRSFMQRTGATPWLAMHVSKPSEGRTERKHRVRGASAWRNACRMVWWTEPCDGGMELDPIKANRLARPERLRIRRTVTSDPDHPLMWRAAHLALDRDGTVVHRDVVRMLEYVASLAQPPSGREAEEGDHGLSRDKAREALGIGRTRGWLTTVSGPRRAQLWSVSDAGKARLMLSD